LVEVVPANFPRFDHDPVTGECLGLLVEESRQNLLSFSDSFMSGTGWGTASGTREENVGVSPDGTTTADKIISTGGGVFRAGITVSNATAYTYSIFIKNFAGTGRINALGFERFGSTVVNAIIDIDLISGTILSSTANVSSSSILSYPNGWYRVSVTTTSVDTTATVVNYTSISGNEYLLWGAQFEQGSFPSSYMPTTASTVTRTADNASITGTNFSSWYNPSEGTVFATFKCDNWNSSNQFGKAFTINQAIFGVEDNGFWIGNDANNSNTIRYRVRSGGVNQFGPANLTRTSTIVKSAIAVKSSDFAVTIDGNTPTTSTSGTLPQVMNSLTIGRDVVGVEDKFLNGTISKLSYYPTRLPNQIIQNLTK
jgi:hypothetical protein